MKHACVKSVGIIDAPPEKVFQLFENNDRVCEYNEHVKIVEDAMSIPIKSNYGGKTWAKVTWNTTPSYGPFKVSFRSIFLLLICTTTFVL